jgi:hypothetical protein
MLQSIRLYFLALSALAWCVNALPDNSKFETVHNSNAAILNRLGLSPLEIPDGHHKKRLAGPEPPGLPSLQSRIHQPYNRRHGHLDSHVYFVKLPASPPYYTITKPHKKQNIDGKNMIKNNDNVGVITNDGISTDVIHHQSPSVGFHSNGKPAKIYHWNLPLVKKATEKKRLHTLFRIDQIRKRFEKEKMNYERQQNLLQTSLNNPIKIIKNQELSKKSIGNNMLNFDDKSVLIKHARNNDKRLNYPSELKRVNEITDNNKRINETNKMSRLEDSTFYNISSITNNQLLNWSLSNDLYSTKNHESQKLKKHRKKAAMSYYAPITSKTGSTSINKNFPGNGRPKAFYVMEKSRKPVYYHPLLP